MKMRSQSINGIKMLSAKTPDWLDNTIEFASNAYLLFFLIGLTNKLYEKTQKEVP